MSGDVAEEIRDRFGAAHIKDKNAAPKIRVGRELVPFTRKRYDDYLRKRPAFYIEEDRSVVTPTVADFARCAHAILATAEEHGGGAPVIKKFLRWTTQMLDSDAALERFKKSFDKLFPGARAKSDAYLVVTTAWAPKLEEDVQAEERRRAGRRERQRKRTAQKR